MKQKMTRWLAGMLAISLLIVGLSGSAWAAKPYKIMVFTFRSSGIINDAYQGYLDSLKKDLNFEFDIRFCGDQGAEFYKRVETAIAEGYQGIITLTDKGNTNEVVTLCAENKVWIGGAWHNQAATLNTSAAGFNFLANPYYLGNLGDGEDGMDTPFKIYAKEVAKCYNALPEAEKAGSIGIATMPAAWQPAQQGAVEIFYQSLRTEYNIPESAFATKGSQVSIRKEDVRIGGKPLKAGSIQWPSMDATSRSLPTTYFEENPTIKFFPTAVPYNFLESTLQTANLHGKIKVWTLAFDKQEALIKNFGTKGDKTYQGTRTSPIEAVAFPLVQILDRLAGKSYPDREAFMAEVYGKPVEKTNFKLKNYLIFPSSVVILTSDEQMDAFADHSVYGTGKGSDAMLPAAELKQYMKTYNPDATYDALAKKFGVTGDLTVEKIMAVAKSNAGK